MPKYRLKINAEIEVEAPNVAKAATVAKKARLIGQHIGTQRDSHDRDMWHKELKVIEFNLSRPVRKREYWYRCDICGRFIKYEDFRNGKATRHMVTPDSDLSCEEYETFCFEHAHQRYLLTGGR